MNRIENLRKIMAGEGVDALVISSEVNQAYISGLDYTDGYVLVMKDEAYVLADFRSGRPLAKIRKELFRHFPKDILEKL